MSRHTRLAAAALLGAVAAAELMSSASSFAATTQQARHASHAPKFAYARVKCVVTSHEDLPGQPNVPLYSPRLTWKVQHATGMALSVDNPGLVGSYGTYGKSGKLFLGGGCYQGDGQTTITFYTVGGHGKRAHKTIIETGTMTRPTAPPEA